MADIDIADPGASDAALKAALAALGMPVLLAGDSISSPVASFDLALPAGYTQFKLELYRFRLDQSDNFSLRFSDDGGLTFHSTSGDYSFNFLWAESDVSGTGGSAGVGTYAATDDQAWLNYGNQDASNTTSSFFCSVDIDPGTAALKAITRARSDIRTTAAHFISWQYAKLEATVGRQNYIRIGGYFGDGDMLVSGDYRLFGIV